MEKLYTQKEYQAKAEQANKNGLFLYQLVKEQEYTVEVLEYEKKIVSQDIYSEDGEVIGTEEVEIDDLDKPIMWEEEIINLETGEIEIVTVQKHHPELRTKTVAELVIAPKGYYVCFKDNYTNGSINPNFEEEQAQKEAERIAMLSLTKREVFLAIFKDKGITPEQIRNQITDTEALIEFDYAEKYYRGNPLINILGTSLGYTEEQLNYLFKNKSFASVEASESNTEVTANA